MDDFEVETGMPALDGKRITTDAAYEAALMGDFDLMDFSLAAIVSLPDGEEPSLRKSWRELNKDQKDVVLSAATELFLTAENEKTPAVDAALKLTTYFALMQHFGRDGSDESTLDDLGFDQNRLQTAMKRLTP